MNFEGKRINNKGLKYLNKIAFKEINVLNLSFNEISDINILEHLNLTKLKDLYLSHNFIPNINIVVYE